MKAKHKTNCRPKPQVKLDRTYSPDCYTGCMSVESYSSVASFCFGYNEHSGFATTANFFNTEATIACSKPDSCTFSTQLILYHDS